MRQEGSRNKDCQTEKSIIKLCLRDKIWKYRGEGNANLVIALPKERLILRLHKWERGKEVTPQVEVEEDKRVWREVLFCRSVMVPLLGSAYIQPPKLAYLDSEEIIKLDTALRPLRPVYRLHKGIKFGYVTIYPDYALLPTKLSLNSECLNNCQKLLPLKSIENHNYSSVDDVCASVINVKRNDHCKNVLASYCFLRDYESDNDDDYENCSTGSDSFDETDLDNDDIFIENYKNINKSIDIPSIYNRTENYVINNCQLPLSRNCYQIRNTRRFSTGSDFSNVPNKCLSSPFVFNSVANQQQMVSSSAPVYSQLILDKNNQNIPVFCVEIKPKQGWIPLMDRFNRKCTFCLNQYLKLSKGSVETISRYCPLDLFSGNEFRMRDALKNLLITPQNNLKLFRDGVMIYSGDMKTNLYSILNEWFKPASKYLTKEENLNKLIDKFCDSVINALTTDLTDCEKFPRIENVTMPECSDLENNMYFDSVPSSPVICSSNHILSSSQPCDWSSQLLPRNCILDRILKIQQLEQSGAEAVYRIYKYMCPKESDYEYVSKLCDHPDGVLKLDPIQRYLLATTAKDCSILIAFQRINSDNCSTIKTMHVMKDTDRVSYAWNIGISDLDPKPLSCIEKHRKRDADVISAFVEYLKNM